MSKNEELIIEFEEIVENDVNTGNNVESEKAGVLDNTKAAESEKNEEELLKIFEEEYNEGRDERSESAKLLNNEFPVAEDNSEDDTEYFDEDDIEYFDEDDDIEEYIDREELTAVELDDYNAADYEDDEKTGEAESSYEDTEIEISGNSETEINESSRTETSIGFCDEKQKTEADRALEEYERRMEAEEAKRKEEEAEIYRQLMHSQNISKEIVSGETMIVETVSKKTDYEIKEAEEISTPPIDEQVIEINERVSANEKKPVYITDAGRLPLSVAIETDGGMVSRIAQIGDVLPVKCTREFFIESMGVTSVALNIYAGERPLTSQNRLISKTKIKGVHTLSQGRAVVTAEFEIDTECNIVINVIDEGSLKKRTSFIAKTWVPSDDEIYRIVQDARKNLDADNKVRERIRMIQQARECLFEANEMLNAKKKLSISQKSVIKRKCKRLKQRLRKTDIHNMSDVVERGILDAIMSLNNELR